MNMFVPTYETFTQTHLFKNLNEDNINNIVEEIFNVIKNKEPESINIWLEEFGDENSYKKMLYELVNNTTQPKQIEKYLSEENIDEGIFNKFFKSKLFKGAAALGIADLIVKAIKGKNKNIFSLFTGTKMDSEEAYKNILQNLVGNVGNKQGLSDVLSFLEKK